MPLHRSPPSLRAQAIAHLARREFGRQELRERLLRRPARADAHWQPPDAALLDATLDALQAAGYLSDARAAAQRVASRSPREGLRRLTQDLARRGLAMSADDQARLLATEAERAHAVWQRRFDGPPADERERARQWRFLLSRGFEPAVVARVVPRAASGNGAFSGEDASDSP